MNKARRRAPWTFTADNPTARARTIARGCWHALARVDPATAEKIRAQAAQYGEDVWLTPTLAAHVEDEPLTREQLADLAGVELAAVAMWGRRGIRRGGTTTYLRPAADGRYDHSEAVEFLALRATPATREKTLPPCPTRSASRSVPGTADARPASTRSASTC